MSDALAVGSRLLVAWAVALALLLWPRLPPFWRRGLALLASALGIVFLIAATRAEGLRETPTMADFLVGEPLVAHYSYAAASLPHYVMTASCLLLGTLGLALSDRQVNALARHWLALAIALSLMVTVLRFSLEKAAAPPGWARVVGITWLAPVIGAVFAANVRREGGGPRALLTSLAVYAVTVRAAVALWMLTASTFRLGSHYDVSAISVVIEPFTHRVHEFAPGSLSQVMTLGVLPQLVFWPLFTVVAGLLGAVGVLAVERET